MNNYINFKEEVLLVEIKVRGLSPDVISSIDYKANELGVSRNEYLKGVLTREANNFSMKRERKEYEKILNKFAEAMEFTHKRLENNEDLFVKMFALTSILTGLELEEMEELLKERTKGLIEE